MKRIFLASILLVSACGVNRGALPGIGERAQISANVYLLVKEIRGNSIEVSWIAENGAEFPLRPGKIAVEKDGRTYTAEDFTGGSDAMRVQNTFTSWVEFPGEAQPLNKCIMNYDRKPLIDLGRNGAVPK